MKEKSFKCIRLARTVQMNFFPVAQAIAEVRAGSNESHSAAAQIIIFQKTMNEFEKNGCVDFIKEAYDINVFRFRVAYNDSDSGGHVAFAKVKALEKNRRNRYQSAEALMHDLMEFLSRG